MNNLMFTAMLRGFAAVAIYLLTMGNGHADKADIVDLTIESVGNGQFRINATVAHEDTGWDHYADRWDVLDEAGNLLGSRELAHPHVNEQPFTRSVSVSIPASVKTVTVRANDSVHELGGATMQIDVPHP